MNKRISIVGGGNLGTAIAEGLISSGFIYPADIMVTKRSLETLLSLKEKGVSISSNNVEAVKFADVVILAVKPFKVHEVLVGVKETLNENHIILSVVTGVYIKDVYSIIEKKIPVFRAMPNTAIAISESMICTCFENATTDQVVYVEAMFNQLG